MFRLGRLSRGHKVSTCTVGPRRRNRRGRRTLRSSAHRPVANTPKPCALCVFCGLSLHPTAHVAILCFRWTLCLPFRRPTAQVAKLGARRWERASLTHARLLPGQFARIRLGLRCVLETKGLFRAHLGPVRRPTHASIADAPGMQLARLGRSPARAPAVARGSATIIDSRGVPRYALLAARAAFPSIGDLRRS
jgi:hypothetical protein